MTKHRHHRRADRTVDYLAYTYEQFQRLSTSQRRSVVRMTLADILLPGFVDKILAGTTTFEVPGTNGARAADLMAEGDEWAVYAYALTLRDGAFT